MRKKIVRGSRDCKEDAQCCAATMEPSRPCVTVSLAARTSREHRRAELSTNVAKPGRPSRKTRATQFPADESLAASLRDAAHGLAQPGREPVAARSIVRALANVRGG